MTTKDLSWDKVALEGLHFLELVKDFDVSGAVSHGKSVRTKDE